MFRKFGMSNFKALIIGILTFANLQVSVGLFTDRDLKVFECQDGWTGKLPDYYADWHRECTKDKTVPPACQLHCVSKKFGIYVDGEIWLYKLVLVLRMLFPGEKGRETVDKLIDVILECGDHHVKSVGKISTYHCYREKSLWNCVHKNAEKICHANQLRRLELKKSAQKHHHDSLVKSGKNAKESKKMVLRDY